MTESAVPGCTVVDHPLVKDKVAVLRNRETPSSLFRRTLRELTELVAFEATRDLKLLEFEVTTPLQSCTGHRLAREVTVVPILRAGLGMADGMLNIMPEARVGHIGLYRDEKTFEPHHYYLKMPPDLAKAEVFLVDPMLATGQSASDAAAELKNAGARFLRLVVLVGSVPGARLFRERHPDVPVYMAVMDPGIDARAYIVPGLGDAGDRYFGT